MMYQRGFTTIVVYLDDVLVIESTKQECQFAFDTLYKLLLSLGFQISPSKLVYPYQQLTFLGWSLTLWQWSSPYPRASSQKPESSVIPLLLVNVHLNANYSNWQASLIGHVALYMVVGPFYAILLIA